VSPRHEKRRAKSRDARVTPALPPTVRLVVSADEGVQAHARSEERIRVAFDDWRDVLERVMKGLRVPAATPKIFEGLR
jgi:hypothetical protein